MTRPYAFTFWHSGETPGYIDLCLATQRRNLGERFEHVHLDLDSVREWVPEHELLWEMSVPDEQGRSVSAASRRIALYAGMLRVALLHRHGGLWVDADTIVFPQLGLLADLVDTYDLLCGESSGGNISNAIMGGRPGSAALASYWASVLERIERKRASGVIAAKWGEFGFRMLRATVLETGGEGVWVAPWGVLDTVDAHLDRPTFTPGSTIEESLSPHALDLSIFNNATEEDVRRRAAGDLLAERTLLSSAYRVAMGEEECPHLGIQSASQLHTLNRAALMVRRLELSDRRVAELHRLRERKEQLRQRLDVANTRHEELAARLRRRTEQRDEARATLRRRTQQRDQARARLRARRGEAAQLSQRIEELERPFRRLRALARRLRRRRA